MATVYKVHEAKTHLSRLLEQVEAGEHVTIARGSMCRTRIDPRLFHSRTSVSGEKSVVARSGLSP